MISLIVFNQLQVSVELGLCEMMNKEAIRPQFAPKDGNWGFDIAEREAMLPAGTVDQNVKRVYETVQIQDNLIFFKPKFVGSYSCIYRFYW